MDRRGFLTGTSGLLAAVAGCATSRPDSDTDGDSPTQNTENATATDVTSTATSTDTSSRGNYAVIPHTSNVYHASPSSPDCPSHGDKDGSPHWGMIEKKKYTVDAQLDSPARAHEWVRDEIGFAKRVAGVDTIQWKGREYDIEREYETTKWYLFRVSSTYTVLIVPRDDRTSVREYWYGDC